VQLTPHRATLKADGEDISVITVQVADPQGRAVPTAGNLITFEVTGPGKIIGVGNGDPSSHEPDQFIATEQSQKPAWQRSLFNGLVQVIVQSTKEAGEIKLTARSTGLAETMLVLTAKPLGVRPALP
jgi:beta-galactosidase